LPIGGRLQNGQLVGSIIFYRDLTLKDLACDIENTSEYGTDEMADICEEDNDANINPTDLNIT
jgi:hypothetical protein